MDYNGRVLKDNWGAVHTIYGSCCASGGEGEIYALSGEPEYVAKIYYEKYRTAERHSKLETMMQTDYNILPECAWPVSILYDDSGFCGFIMRNMSGYIGLIDFYVFDNRSKYTWAQFVTVAMNIAAVVSSLHELGHVVGDLNSNNILVDVNTCKVAFVDTDSYHIRSREGTLYPCIVAVPEFAAPELQGVEFQKLAKNQSVFDNNTDYFSLAVLIFRILMNGVHPFTCSTEKKEVSVSDFQPVKNIKNGYCAFFSGTNLNGDLKTPLQAPSINMLPVKMRIMFKEALLGRTKRPSSEEWYYELLSLRKSLCRCSTEHRHEYYYELTECPWCAFRKNYNAKLKALKDKLNKIKEGTGKNNAGDFTQFDRIVGRNSSQSTSNVVPPNTSVSNSNKRVNVNTASNNNNNSAGNGSRNINQNPNAGNKAKKGSGEKGAAIVGIIISSLLIVFSAFVLKNVGTNNRAYYFTIGAISFLVLMLIIFVSYLFGDNKNKASGGNSANGNNAPGGNPANGNNPANTNQDGGFLEGILGLLIIGALTYGAVWLLSKLLS